MMRLMMVNEVNFVVSNLFLEISLKKMGPIGSRDPMLKQVEGMSGEDEESIPNISQSGWSGR